MRIRGPRQTIAAAVILGASPLLFASCGPKPAAASARTPAFLETPVEKRSAAREGAASRGKTLYDANCAQCHGPNGDGNGFGAPFQVPPPRDFTAGAFKFRTTESGALPSDDDLFRIISRGVNGTGMPPWQYLLTADERWDLVDYVKTFSPRFVEQGPPAPAPIPARPSRAADAARGKRLYTEMQCAKCHGTEGRGDGPSALTLLDSKGRRINSRDFTNPGAFRTGWTEAEIVRTFETGLNGTPMPSYAGAMNPEEEYDLAAYVMSLAGPGVGDQKRLVSRGMSGLGKPERVIALREHAWKYEPAEIRVKAGEVVKVELSTTDNGLGAGHGFALDGLDQQVFINGAMVGAPQSVTFKVDRPGRYTFYCSTQCSTRELHPKMNGVLVVEARDGKEGAR
jgi:mono/diheme cytochrome c family protein